MAYIDPKIRTQFDTLSSDLKDAVMNRDVKINTLNDLIATLEIIANES